MATDREFPLQRLCDHYRVRFTDTEEVIIQTFNRLFWLVYSDYAHQLPPGGFQGTAMELWGIIMIVSERIANVQHAIRAARRTTPTPTIIPRIVSEEFELILNWHWCLTPSTVSILEKICLPIRRPSSMSVSTITFFGRVGFRSYADLKIEKMLNNFNQYTREVCGKPFSITRAMTMLTYPDFTDLDIAVLNVGYHQILWSQLTREDQYIMPTPVEVTPMELWLMQYILYKHISPKSAIGCHQAYPYTGLVACSLYIPNIIAKYGAEKGLVEEVDAYLWFEQHRIIHKISKVCRERIWKLQMSSFVPHLKDFPDELKDKILRLTTDGDDDPYNGDDFVDLF